MLNVLIVSQEYPPETAHGGIGTQAFLKANGLAKLGHRVTVLSRAIGQVQTETTIDAVRIIRIPGMEHNFELHSVLTDQITYSVKVAEAISKILAAHPIDLIEFPEYGNEGFVFLTNQSIWQHTPTVVQLHGPLVMFGHAIGWPEMDCEFYRVGTAMEAASLRSASAIYSSSRCSAKWVSDHYGLAESSIPLLHTGVDTQLFYPNPEPTDSQSGFRNSPPVILFAGNVSDSKGADVLIRAVIAIAPQFPGISVRLFGKCTTILAVELQQEAVEKGCASVVDYRGYVTREQLAAEMRQADIFAMPSDYEGGPGFVYLEAMASGLPCIGTENSGATEAFIPGETGLLVPQRNIEKLSDALRTLLDNRPMRQAMGIAARDYVLEHADSRKCLKKLEAFFESVVVSEKLRIQELQSR